MKFLVALSCLFAAACASGVVAPAAYSYSTNVIQHGPVAYAAPVAYSAPVAHTVAAAPVAYTAPVSHTVTHTETRVAAPVAHAVAAAPVAYTAPVAAAPVAYAAPVAHAVAAAPVAYTAKVAHAAPVAYAAPVAHAVAAPVVTKSQYHAQNEIGQASYGHAEPFQAHNAVQDAAGNKVGSYSYVAPNGQVISANYVADALGYRVSSNALPVGPAPVVDTPEVHAAKVAHLQHFRARRSVAVAAPLAYSAYYPAPVYRAATLTNIVHTPAHAVSYRVF